jgi:MFS transporter, putative metabolite:H+ symporter
MFERLDTAPSLTGNQIKIIAAAITGDMLEFFDYFLIGFVLAFIVKPWGLTFGQSAIILLSSGIGAILGAFIWGRIADLIGRRAVFIATVINFSVATFVLAFTPDHGWVYLSIFRFFVGFGVGGLYCVDLPLVQEFMPTRMRGFIGGLVTAFIPMGVMIASVLGAFLAPEIGWRGLFLVGLAPALFTLVIRAWVPESPHWLVSQGRTDDARRSLAWALKVPPASLPLPQTTAAKTLPPTRWTDIFTHPRSVAVSWMAWIGVQTAGYAVGLWGPTLFVLQLNVTPSHAAYLFIYVTAAGFLGRILFSILNEAIGRRVAGIMVGFGGAVCLAVAGLLHNMILGGVSLFWLFICFADFFYDGGSAVIGPYSAEVWPTRLRTTGMGSAYGFGGLGKIIGPLGLALIVGSSNVVKPEVTVSAIPATFLFLAAWMVVTGLGFALFGFETRRRSITELDDGYIEAPVPAMEQHLPVEVRAASKIRQ